MKHCFNHANYAIPITIVTEESFSDDMQNLSEAQRRWCDRNNFKGKAGTYCLIPDEKGEIEQVIASGDVNDIYSLAYLATQLPPDTFEFVGIDPKLLNLHYLMWGLACYRYDRYKSSDKVSPALRLVDVIQEHELKATLEAIYLIRDLINTPCSDLSPDEFADVALEIAESYSADCEVISGKKLEAEFPLVAAVGRASATPPCLVDMRWGEEAAPKITLVGKGIVFDSGGLNLKPGNSMRLMKKDMAGAAHALGLAKLIMELDLDIQLRVILPLAENAVAGNAFRPGDILPSRLGKSVEIGNTDAEGRLILADALAYASEDNPKVVIDFASLTGAARVAVGTEIAAMFCNDAEQSRALCYTADDVQDAIWPLPLYKPYRSMIDTPFADIANDPASPYGSAITAALFLQDFVGDHTWFHFDIMAWNLSSKPGRPEGGEAMAVRGVLEYLRANF